MDRKKKEIDREPMKNTLAAATGPTLAAGTGDRGWARSVATPDLSALSLAELSKMVRRGAITSKRLVELYLERITKFDGREGLNAYITVMGDAALKQAEELDKLAKSNTHGSHEQNTR